MKQLDVDVSPPAFLWDPYLTLANVTFDLDPSVSHNSTPVKCNYSVSRHVGDFIKKHFYKIT